VSAMKFVRKKPNFAVWYVQERVDGKYELVISIKYEASLSQPSLGVLSVAPSLERLSNICQR